MSVFLKIYYVIYIYIFFSAGVFRLPLPSFTPDALAIGFILLSAQPDGFKLKLPRKEGSYFINMLLIPAVIIFIYSLVIQTYYSFSTDYYFRTITMCARMVLYSFVGFRAVQYFGTKFMDLMLLGCAITYAPTIIQFFWQNGFISGIVYLLSPTSFYDGVALEVHRLTYVFGFIAIYYLYQKIVNRKRVVPQMIISVILLLLGMKRIAMAALLIAVLCIFVSKLVKEKVLYKTVKTCSIIMVFVAMGYIFMIRSRTLQEIFEVLNIEDSFRFNFWNYISSKYEFSPTFFGYGISYPHRMMAHEWDNIKDLGMATNLHNDVLGYYLGIGFVGSVMFWLLFFLGQVTMLKKRYSTNLSAFAFILSLFYFIIMTMTNEGLPGAVYGIYMTVIFSSIAAYEEREKQEEITE